MDFRKRMATAAVKFLQSSLGEVPTVTPGPEPYDCPGGVVSRGMNGVIRGNKFGDHGRPIGSYELHRGGRVLIHTQGASPQPAEIAAALAIAGADTTARPGDGISGLNAIGGMISDDYNSDLAPLVNRMEMYEQMRRSDGALAVIENLLVGTIQAADWRLEGGDDIRFRDRLWADLQDGMSHAFSETRRQAILAVLYGFTMHQIVPERKDDGFEGIRKFQELGRKTVNKWDFDSSGGVQGFEQTGVRLDTSEYVNQYIPIEQLVIWTHRGDLGNPEGMGAYRQGVKHWRLKELLETWAAMRIERTAIPYPKWTPPSYNTNKDYVDEVLAISDRILTGECVGIVVPAGWQLELLWGGPSDVPFLDMIEWEHQCILQAVLGQFVGYGSGGQSAGAPLGREAADVFLLTMNTVADWLCDTFNRHVIPKIWRWNWGTKWCGRRSKVPPKLAHTKIGMKDPDAFVRLIRGLLDRNTLMVPDLLHQLISISGLAPISDKDAEEICDMKNSNAALNSRGIQEQSGRSEEQRTTPDSTSAENGLANMRGEE